jgi:hypothetical protein
MESVREEHEVGPVRYKFGYVVGVARHELAVGDAVIVKAMRDWARSFWSMSTAVTWLAILAICKVNQPSPEHRSTTFIPGRMPNRSQYAGGVWP